MPLELTVWRIDSGKTRVRATTLDFESRLEDLLADDISIADLNWMVIGRQVATPWGKRIDLLCINTDGNLVVLELKRDKTDREVVAQALDYGSYVRRISSEEILRIFNDYQKAHFPKQSPQSLEEAFCNRFKVKKLPEELNSSHELVIVASTLDAATERIVGYLAELDVSINAVFFQVFKDDDREYLTRAWLRDPTLPDDAAANHSIAAEDCEWNQEYYVNFGHDDHRDWDDAIKYGFVSAGGGTRFQDAMKRLEIGDRVWVIVPGQGYVGVGKVVATAVPLQEFHVADTEGRAVPILSAPIKCKDFGSGVTNPDMIEHLVRVEWLKTVPLSRARWERGFFSNQNCVVAPKNAKWPYTIERLKQYFGIDK